MPLDYLIKLHHGQLPVTVTSPADLKQISLLKATGLIEATLALSGAPDKAFQRIEAALVQSITDAGKAEITAATGHATHGGLPLAGGNTLALEYLRLIEYCSLPISVTEHSVVDSVEALARAGLVDATIETLPRQAPMPGERSARVHRITEVGHDFLSRKHGKAVNRTRSQSLQTLQAWISASAQPLEA